MHENCGRCLYFQNDPAVLERELPGLASMGSGYAAVRAEDGICRRHGLYLSARDYCPNYTAAPALGAQAAKRPVVQ